MSCDSLAEKIKLIFIGAILSSAVLLSCVLNWQTATVHIVVALLWFSRAMRKPAGAGVFFWLFLVDLFFLIYNGIGKAWLAETPHYGALCLFLLAALLAAALLEKIPAIFRRPSHPQLPGLLIFSTFALALAALLYVLLLIPYLLQLKTPPVVFKFAGIATDEGLRMLPGLFSSQYEMTPYYAIALSCSALFVAMIGIAAPLRRVMARRERPPCLLSLFVLALAVVAVYRLSAYARDYLSYDPGDHRVGCAVEEKDLHEINPPPENLIRAAAELEDYSRLAELLQLRARSARIVQKPLEAVVDYARLISIAPHNGANIAELAAAMSQAGQRNDGLRLAFRLIDSGDDLKGFEPCLIDDYETLTDLWMRYGGEEEQAAALEPLAPKDGEEYKGDRKSRRHALMLRYASLCVYTGRIDEARRVAEAALKLSRYDAAALNVMGEIAYRQEDFYRALEYFDDAVSLERGNYLYLFNLLSVLALENDRETLIAMQGGLLQEYEPSFWQGTQGNELRKSGTAELELVMPPGWSQFGVLAHGMENAGKYPSFEVRINDEHIADFEIESEDDVPYTCEFYARRGVNRVQVVFHDESKTPESESTGVKLFLGGSMARPVFWPDEIRWP